MTAFLVRYRWTFSDYVAAICCFVFLLLTVYWFLYDVRDKIDVQYIVTRELDGRNVLDIERKLTGDFDGIYEVTIRNTMTGERVCMTGPIRGPYQEYQEDGKLVRLPDPTELSWWAYGGTCTKILEDGLPDGSYSMKTCHSVRPLPFLPFKQHCWPLTFFTLPPETMNQAVK